ncbi:ankyrin repeat domain-containing protein [Sansalvadorimonas sp. 2012CJ34-2]|uniref:Ankyrin repeat domain-containing protein n=1 Tax=Parendozoicomonas callyspongiae TaxID=2942213 RepID=A0ABT0PJV6_9GAMM|nr:ankyrin repeat domain-containing protein [Sansalvadorimonas sp. 2012CJ34-2]MCL6270748.1 ankyrin repeat domain-containing protein [Sansalvadorimonas sp. 2012CJ34-2]
MVIRKLNIKLLIVFLFSTAQLGLAMPIEEKPTYILSPSEIFKEKKVRQLCIAGANGDVKQVKKLISNGVDVNARGYRGLFPLYCAAKSKEKQTFKLLLESGANPNLNWNSGTVIHLLAEQGSIDLMKIAVAHGGNINLEEPIGKNTPIVSANRYFHRELIDYLIEVGADLNKKNVAGTPPLFFLAMNNQWPSIYLAISKGVDLLVIEDGIKPVGLDYYIRRSENRMIKESDYFKYLLLVKKIYNEKVKEQSIEK